MAQTKGGYQIKPTLSTVFFFIPLTNLNHQIIHLVDYLIKRLRIKLSMLKNSNNMRKVEKSGYQKEE
jgi:hypothetical protein